MNNTFETIIVNRHLLINDGRGNMLIDTGSPASFHVESQIHIGDDTHIVPTSYIGTSTQYLSQKEGCEIVGLIGMDILSQYTVWINTPQFGNFILFSKGDTIPSTYPVESFTIMSIPGIYMEVNGQRAKLLFDTGAHISYISDSYFHNLPIARQSEDFSPLLNAEFNVDLYNLPTHFCDKMVNVEFGSMPLELTAMILQLHVDGIVGYDLIQHFRIVLDKGIVKIPPQGI